MRIATFALIFVLALTAACAGPRDNRARTPHEACISACNRDFDICMDESSNSREVMQGMGRLPSAGRGCDNSLKSCQDRCRGL